MEIAGHRLSQRRLMSRQVAVGPEQPCRALRTASVSKCATALVHVRRRRYAGTNQMNRLVGDAAQGLLERDLHTGRITLLLPPLYPPPSYSMTTPVGGA